MSLFSDASDDLSQAVLYEFGETYTYTPLDGSDAYEITGARNSGERFEQSQPGAYAALFVTRADMEAEPVKGDTVTVPSGRRITAGNYRVADIHRENEHGRTLLLQWMRT